MRKLTERQRERLELAYILGLEDGNSPHFPDYRIGDRDSAWWRWDGEYITVFDLSGGFRPVPEFAHGKRLVHSYVASERECPWCGDGTGNEAARPDCDLCEGDGLLYRGEIGCHVYEVTGR